MLIADFDKSVSWVVSQPFLLEPVVEGQVRRHVLDYLLFTDDGPVVVGVLNTHGLVHGAQLPTAVVEEAQRLRGAVLLVLEDVDLLHRGRATGRGGLSELLQAMDIQSGPRVLTLVSTNDANTLDKAAIRSGRFDSIVGSGYPNRTDAARILQLLVTTYRAHNPSTLQLRSLPCPSAPAGCDFREIVRRVVLVGDGRHVTTTALLAEGGTIPRHRSARTVSVIQQITSRSPITDALKRCRQFCVCVSAPTLSGKQGLPGQRLFVGPRPTMKQRYPVGS